MNACLSVVMRFLNFVDLISKFKLKRKMKVYKDITHSFTANKVADSLLETNSVGMAVDGAMA